MYVNEWTEVLRQLVENPVPTQVQWEVVVQPIIKRLDDLGVPQFSVMDRLRSADVC